MARSSSLSVRGNYIPMPVTSPACNRIVTNHQCTHLLQCLSYVRIAVCDGQADIVIAIDASGSIRLNRFTMVLDYVRTVVNALEVAEDRARVGVIVFSDSATVKFHMNTYKTKQDILQAIETIDYIRGKTNIADVLRKMRTEMFTVSYYAYVFLKLRPVSYKYVLHIFDRDKHGFAWEEHVNSILGFVLLDS